MGGVSVHLTATILWRLRSQTKRHLMAHNPEQESFCASSEKGRKTRTTFNRKIQSFSFLKKIDQNISIILNIWAQSSNFLWLRLQCYGGPILAQEYVNSSRLFLQHWSWQASKSRTFCFYSSQLFEARWLTLCNILLFSSFSSQGPPPIWDWWGRESYETPATVGYFFSVLLMVLPLL